MSLMNIRSYISWDTMHTVLTLCSAQRPWPAEAGYNGGVGGGPQRVLDIFGQFVCVLVCVIKTAANARHAMISIT